MKKNGKKETTGNKDIVAEIEKRFERHTGVLMEQMLHEVKTVAEGHGIIIRKLEGHDDKFAKHDDNFAKLESELNTAKMAVMDISRRVNQIDKKLDHALDNHEKRLVKLEEKVA